MPHYTSLFSALLRGPQPWRFGSLLLPEGSKNLGAPEYALRPGTQVRCADPRCGWALGPQPLHAGPAPIAR